MKHEAWVKNILSDESAYSYGYWKNNQSFMKNIVPAYIDVSIWSASIEDLKDGIKIKNPYTWEDCLIHSVFMRFKA